MTVSSPTVTPAVDENGFRFVDGDAVVHQLAGFALAQNGVELRELAAGVDAEHLAGVRGAQGQHGRPSRCRILAISVR